MEKKKILIETDNVNEIYKKYKKYFPLYYGVKSVYKNK
mgnify:CR=1 FL=1